MRALRRGLRGISEVVGALMLVLIVVVAATSLAIFVASYQKQLQSEQSIQQQRGLEHLTIIHATPTLAPGGAKWAQLNFSLASLYINPSTLTEISINDNPLRQYNASQLDLSTGLFVSIVVAPGGQLTLAPREQVVIQVDLNNTTAGFSFYNSSFVLHTADFVKIDVFTNLQNDFDRVFIPPTAIAIVTALETLNGTNFTTVPVLDGTNSFQPGNATIIAWTWAITPDNTTAGGEKAVVSFDRAFALHHVTLTVTNTDGLQGTDTVLYST